MFHRRLQPQTVDVRLNVDTVTDCAASEQMGACQNTATGGDNEAGPDKFRTNHAHHAEIGHSNTPIFHTRPSPIFHTRPSMDYGRRQTSFTW